MSGLYSGSVNLEQRLVIEKITDLINNMDHI